MWHPVNGLKLILPGVIFKSVKLIFGKLLNVAEPESFLVFVLMFLFVVEILIFVLISGLLTRIVSRNTIVLSSEALIVRLSEIS